MNNELVSIIIPIYNVEKYLDECVKSVLEQTYKNIEILLIDDGSKDSSGRICDYYAQTDSRVRVHHKENGGLSDARNFGIEHAKGKYITFIDSDDYVFPDYVQNLVSLIMRYNADMSVTCATKFYDSYGKPQAESFFQENSRAYDSKTAIVDMLYRKNIPIYAWAKMYRASLFQKIKFPVGELFEDLSTEYLFMYESDRIAFNPVRDYCYRQRKNSIINSGYTSDKMIQVYTTEKIIKFLEANYADAVNAGISKCFVTTLNLYKNIPNEKKYKTEREYAREILKKYRKIVLYDKNNKKFTRVIAGLTVISVELSAYIGKIYQILTEKNILKLKKPI